MSKLNDQNPFFGVAGLEAARQGFESEEHLFLQWLSRVETEGDNTDLYFALYCGLRVYCTYKQREKALRIAARLATMQAPLPAMCREIASWLFTDFREIELAHSFVRLAYAMIPLHDTGGNSSEQLRLSRIELALIVAENPRSDEVLHVLDRILGHISSATVFDNLLVEALSRIVDCKKLPHEYRFILEFEWADRVRRERFDGDDLDTSITEIEELIGRVPAGVEN